MWAIFLKKDFTGLVWHVNCLPLIVPDIVPLPSDQRSVYFVSYEQNDMSQRGGCGLLCGLACHAGREAEPIQRRTSGTACEISGGCSPEPIHAKSNVQGSSGTHDLHGWKLVVAAAYTLLLPPLLLLVSARLVTTWLGEAVAVGIGLLASLILLLPAHGCLTRNSVRCSVKAMASQRR